MNKMLIKRFSIFLTFALFANMACKRLPQKSVVLEKNDSLLAVSKQDSLTRTQEKPQAIGDVLPVVSKIVVPVKKSEFKYFTAKSRLAFKDENQEQNVNLNIRIRKDSLIWISASLMGIEGGRGIITPAGGIFLDRINKRYIQFNFASLSQRFNFNLDFNLVQALFVGDMPLESRPQDEPSQKDNHYLIHQHEKQLILDNFIDAQSQKLYQLEVSEATSENQMKLSYQNFRDIFGELFPHLIMAQISFVKEQQVKQTLINIEHQRIETSQESPNFPFNIPSSYTKLEEK